jgi:hypothetical protein
VARTALRGYLRETRLPLPAGALPARHSPVCVTSTRTVLACGLALLVAGAAACGAPDAALAEGEERLPAEQAESPSAASHAPAAADTIPVEKGVAVSDSAHIAPRLREVMSSHPDSVVAVLVRLEGPDAVSAEALRAAGLEVGVTVGRVMTGRIRARALPALSAVPGILSIDAAERIEVPRPPGPAVRPNSNDQR